jgi:hypothetical protein
MLFDQNEQLRGRFDSPIKYGPLEWEIEDDQINFRAFIKEMKIDSYPQGVECLESRRYARQKQSETSREISSRNRTDPQSGGGAESRACIIVGKMVANTPVHTPTFSWMKSHHTERLRSLAERTSAQEHLTDRKGLRTEVED